MPKAKRKKQQRKGVSSFTTSCVYPLLPDNKFARKNIPYSQLQTCDVLLGDADELKLLEALEERRRWRLAHPDQSPTSYTTISSDRKTRRVRVSYRREPRTRCE